VNPWPWVVFGWLTLLLALALPVLGITKRLPALLAISAVIATPYSLYLGAAPRVGWPGYMIPVLLIGAGVAVRYRRAQIAWLLLIPVMAVVGCVASLVIRE